jgi:hypothetical protein
VPEYEYQGPGPHEDDEGGIVRPGDVREFAEEPNWGPWQLVEPDGPALAAPPDGKSPPPAAAVVITPDGPKPPPPASTAPAPKQGE